jgi:hypothetical protein
VSANLSTDWQLTNTNTVLFDNNNTSSQGKLFDGWQIGKQKLKLKQRHFGPSPEKNYGRFDFVTQREKSTKIGIRRNEDAVFVRRELKNPRIGSGLELPIAHMNRIVSSGSQAHGDRGRECIVHQEFQERVTGSSRSWTASAAKRSASRISSVSRSG